MGKIEFRDIYENTNGNDIKKKKKEEVVKETCDRFFSIKVFYLVGGKGMGSRRRMRSIFNLNFIIIIIISLLSLIL